MASRAKDIRTLLSPIAKVATGPATKTRSTPGTFIIATYDGSLPQSDFRDWRFKVYVNNMSAGYFEVWKDPERKGKWHLEKAYLHIYTMVPELRDEKEFLCLHCDPNESEEDKHYFYKVGPHIHIKQADSPIPHSHIALNRSHLPEVLSSIDTLTKAFSLGVNMIKEQVLDALLI